MPASIRDRSASLGDVEKCSRSVLAAARGQRRRAQKIGPSRPHVQVRGSSGASPECASTTDRKLADG
jgi:hypothetical protein